jgi:iron-sulfur cluster assembly protein
MSSNSDANDPSRLALPAEWALTDDTGVPETDPIITLTETAEVEVRRLIESEGQPGLRLGIKGGGCSGLSYLLEFTDQREGDTVIEFGEFKVFLDRKSTIYLRDITLDHQGGLEGRGFVFHNPQASNTCGCGESFSL